MNSFDVIKDIEEKPQYTRNSLYPSLARSAAWNSMSAGNPKKEGGLCYSNQFCYKKGEYLKYDLWIEECTMLESSKVHHTLHASHKTAGVTLKLKTVNMLMCKINWTCTSNFKLCFWPKKRVLCISFKSFPYWGRYWQFFFLDPYTATCYHGVIWWLLCTEPGVRLDDSRGFLLTQDFLWFYLKYRINMTTQHCRINRIKQPFTVWLGMNTLNCSSIALKMPKGDFKRASKEHFFAQVSYLSMF